MQWRLKGVQESPTDSRYLDCFCEVRNDASSPSGFVQFQVELHGRTVEQIINELEELCSDCYDCLTPEDFVDERDNWKTI